MIVAEHYEYYRDLAGNRNENNVIYNTSSKNFS